MSNLEKFNKTLDDLDQEVRKLSDISDVYKKIQDQTEICNEIIKQFDENSKALSKINTLQEEQLEKVSNNLVETENLHKLNKIDLTKFIEEKTGQIRRENKEFHNDLEITIKIKISENASQIRQLIESERIQIKQIFELELAKCTKELSLIIEDEALKQRELLLHNQKNIKRWLWIIGAILLILGGGIVYKL